MVMGLIHGTETKAKDLVALGSGLNSGIGDRSLGNGPLLPG
jgi:hypothetical protein